ncbi:MAG TPA: hypothetical protein VGH22_15355 [Candidatus Binatia bacterium]
MSKSTDYTAEEWKAISSAPMLAGLLVSVADISGPVGMVKEAMAVVKAVTETPTNASNELIRAVAEGMKAGEGRPDTSELRTDPSRAREILIQRCKEAAGFVVQKSPAEAEEYKRWLVSLARKAAEASKEGGFLGIGGTLVSDSENAALRDIATALGVRAS